MITLSSFSCLSVVSFAAVVDRDGEQNDDGEFTELYWEYTDDHVLTLYADVTGSPWLKYASEIEKVVVKASVSEICSYAFAGYANLSEVVFEGVFVSINEYAFQNCDKLTEVKLPVVRRFADYAFYDCDNLVSVVVGGGGSAVGDVGKNIFKSCDALETVELANGVIEIGEGMFEDCINLSTVSIPDSVEKIGRLAFENCTALEGIVVPDSTITLGEYAFYGCTSAKTLYIGHNVETIGEYAFGNCSALESVEIMCAMPGISEGMFYGCQALKGLSNLPEGIKVIGKNAFKDCTSFAEIVLPSTVIEIGDSAFDATVITSIDIPVGVEIIGDGAFTNCAALTAINVEAKNRYYASVDGILYDAKIKNLICCPAGKTGSVVVSEGTETIGSDAFIGCVDVDVIEIPESVSEIAPNAFNGRADTLKIKAKCDSYAAEYAKLYAIDIELTHGTYDWVVTVDPTCDTTGVKEKVCVDCAHVEEIKTIDTLKHKYDEGVVTKEPACDTDGEKTFTCQNAGCDHTEVGSIPKLGHKWSEWVVTVEATCDTDGEKARYCQNNGCVEEEKIVIPATSHKLDDGTVKIAPTCDTEGKLVRKCIKDDCSYEVEESIPVLEHKYESSVTVEPLCEVEGVKTFTCTRDGCGHSYTESIPALGGHDYDDGVITKPPTVHGDGEKTFTCKNEWCTEEHENHTLVVPVANTAFDGILDTNEGAYADENGVIQNLTWALTDTYHLFIYADDTSEEWAKHRGVIVAVTIAGDATTVENGSFAYMPALTEANILFSLGKIEAYAFQYCENLKTVFTGSIEEMEEFAFYHCSALESVDIYGGLPEGNVGRNVFLDCVNLSDVTLRNGTLSLGEAMFKGCAALEEITLPESLLVIGDSAFDGTAIKTIRIPTDVKVIEKGVFTNCAELEAINVDSKNDFYFSVDGVLYDVALGSLLLCPAAKSGEVAVWEGTAKIAEDAFIGCKAVTKVTIPDSVTTIADNAFNGCSEGLVIVCNCDSYAAEYAKSRGITAELNHVASAVWKITTEATCLEDGVKERVCSGCDYSYETVVIEALGHDFDGGVETTKVTCETDGVMTYTCTRNGCEESYTEVLPALTHKYDNGVVTFAPTCEADGEKTFTCRNEGCGDSYVEILPAIGHKYDEGVITITPACGVEGEKLFTCKNCGDAYTEILPALTHNYVETVKTEGTCITKGAVEHTCSNCGDSYTEREYGEHQLHSYPVRIEPTCSQEGKEGYMCALCREFVGEVTIIPAISHTEGEWVVDAKATCTVDGSKHKSCTACGTVLATETIPALGHTEGKWIVDKKPTVKAEGKQHKECTECGETIRTEKIKQLKCGRPEVESVSNYSKGVRVDWDSVSGADYYKLYRKTKKGSWKYIDSTKKTAYTDDTAKSGTKYYYSVIAVNEAGDSDRSNSLSRYYLDDPNLKSATSTKKGITLKWSKVEGAEAYIIYRKTESGSYKRIKTVTEASYTDKTAKKGKKYSYKVKALYSKTTSDYSRVKTVKDKY